MSPKNESQSATTTTPSQDEPPYTVTEENGKLKVVFASGQMKGQDFQIELSQIPPPVDNGERHQDEAEPPYPYSFLDGNGNRISEEEYERLAAIEIAEEARMQREKDAAKTKRRA
ncbi:hypothetical protein MBLNU13_g05277t1 [Cladosporium sp. NU13]